MSRIITWCKLSTHRSCTLRDATSSFEDSDALTVWQEIACNSSKANIPRQRLRTDASAHFWNSLSCELLIFKLLLFAHHATSRCLKVFYLSIWTWLPNLWWVHVLRSSSWGQIWLFYRGVIGLVFACLWKFKAYNWNRIDGFTRLEKFVWILIRPRLLQIFWWHRALSLLNVCFAFFSDLKQLLEDRWLAVFAIWWSALAPLFSFLAYWLLCLLRFLLFIFLLVLDVNLLWKLHIQRILQILISFVVLVTYFVGPQDSSILAFIVACWKVFTLVIKCVHHHVFIWRSAKT